MQISPQDGTGVVVEGFDPATADDEEVAALKKVIYEQKIAVLKGQAIDAKGFLALGSRFGTARPYYETIYRHPDAAEVFVSSNVVERDGGVGVPKTGKFWHSDYQFMPRPFDFTILCPQEVPRKNRGTYFLDLSAAYEAFDDTLKKGLADTRALHSVRRYFKIRPTDVYRPMVELMEEIEKRTPPVAFPTVMRHPVTGASVPYVSAGFTYAIEDASGTPQPELLHDVLEATGQLDPTFEHQNIHLQRFERGDVLIWDNRGMVHHAMHPGSDEPVVSYRVTVDDPQQGEWLPA
jgi:alpha-ketoglutarate-dependent taurine dioxygenase